MHLAEMRAVYPERRGGTPLENLSDGDPARRPFSVELPAPAARRPPPALEITREGLVGPDVEVQAPAGAGPRSERPASGPRSRGAPLCGVRSRYAPPAGAASSTV